MEVLSLDLLLIGAEQSWAEEVVQFCDEVDQKHIPVGCEVTIIQLDPL